MSRRPPVAPAHDAGLSPARRLAVVLVWLLVLAAGVGVIARSRVDADLSAFLPAHPDARQRMLIEQIQTGVASRTLFIGIEGGRDEAQRAAVSRELGQRLRKSGLFDQVQNGDQSEWRDAGTWVFDRRYQLSPAVTPEHFTVEGLRNAILDTLSLLGTPGGNAFKPLLERDPTGESARMAETLIPATAPRSVEGVWAAREAPRALLLASTRAAGGDLDAQAQAIATIQADFAQAAAQVGASDTRLLMSGTAVFSVQSRDSIKREAVHLAVVGAIVVSGLLLLAFGALRALAIAMLPVATGVVVGTAAVSLVFGGVHGLTLGFGSTLIGETVDYAIYYLIQARQVAGEGPAQAGWQRWRDLHWPTVRLGLLTSVAGFAALVFSGFPGLAQLGVFSIAGLVAAAVATRFLLPVLAPQGASGRGLRRYMAHAAGALVRGLPRLRLPLMALAIAGFVLVLWQGDQLWRAGLSSMSPVSRESQALDEQLRGDIGASDGATLVVAYGDTVEAALRQAEVAGARLDPLVDRGVLLGYDSVARILPSQALQMQRREALPDATTLRARLEEATAGLPIAADRLTPFVTQVEAARAASLIGREDARQGPLGAVVDALLFERPGGGWAAMVSLHPGPQFKHADVVAALQGLPGVSVAEVGEELSALYKRYLHEAFVQVGLGALAVVLLLGAWLRSGRRLLAVCQPLAAAVALTLGAMAAMGMALSILHLVGLLLVVAVGSNYALFFDQLRETGHADEDTLASLMLANLTTVISFTLIAISDIPSLASIGQVVAPGALLALLLSAAFARTARA
ncbi:MMPL family transporter [Pseudacidovorax sp. RU35E]|uniref:MMPL family transporter n=1 Tax=Pseudacidovorax sp. RU35E TaxID=1907403 RepID=UPI0009564C89|nr:MMPL family transporter [Pseudacidovorax sp. RU35E]SIP90653.1 Predicted exporter [Pseudacidovorax sp. RU35E]